MPQNSSITNAIAISLGAIPGALSRYYIAEWFKAVFGKDFYYTGTFFVNFTGCFIIALFLTLYEKRFKNLSPKVKLLVATGFCGAYTTFSTYGLDTIKLLEQGNLAVAVFYWAGSAITGMLAIQLGVVVANLNSKVAGGDASGS